MSHKTQAPTFREGEIVRCARTERLTHFKNADTFRMCAYKVIEEKYGHLRLDGISVTKPAYDFVSTLVHLPVDEKIQA